MVPPEESITINLIKAHNNKMTANDMLLYPQSISQPSSEKLSLTEVLINTENHTGQCTERDVRALILKWDCFHQTLPLKAQ